MRPGFVVTWRGPDGRLAPAAEASDTDLGGRTPLLFELLNQMDGLADATDIIFVLTTNRPDILEPALAARPGRIDQTIEIPMPDVDYRRRLFALFSRGLEVDLADWGRRTADFRRGRRLGREDHVVRWAKPTSIRSLDWPTYKALPESITVREARVSVAQPGFRTRSVVVVTTLLDPEQATKEDLAELYRAR